MVPVACWVCDGRNQVPIDPVSRRSVRAQSSISVKACGAVHARDVEMVLRMVSELVSAIEDATGHRRLGGKPTADGEHRDADAARLEFRQQLRDEGRVALAVEGESDRRSVTWAVGYFRRKGRRRARGRVRRRRRRRCVQESPSRSAAVSRTDDGRVAQAAVVRLAPSDGRGA